jgi:hypothetical protein
MVLYLSFFYRINRTKRDLFILGKMALLEYLAFKYEKSIPAVISSPQGDNKEEVCLLTSLLLTKRININLTTLDRESSSRTSSSSRCFG